MVKSSKYNIFFPNEDKMVGYNSISDNFVILEPILHELFEASVNENMVEELQDVHESLYDVLQDKGFVIDNGVDELEVIKGISDATDFNDSHYELVINPTMNCNFKCWYCYETHIKDSKMDEGTLDKIVRHVDNLLIEKKDKLKKFSLQWFGGEPLLYFRKTVVPLLREIHPKMVANGIVFESAFTTNGLLINQYVLDECKKYDVSTFQITLDGHRERHNIVRYISSKKGSYDEIVANIKLCLKNKLNVVTRINISAETIDDLLLIIDDFKDVNHIDKQYLSFSFHEVWQEEKNMTADISGIVDQFRSNGLKSAYLGESSASIKESCYADKVNQATINYNGDVYKCTARDFDEGSREGVLEESGAITWNEKFQKRIYDTRFSNRPCLECRILPICNGGCSQHRMENEGVDYCIHDFDENSKLQIVREKFFSRMAFRAPSNHFSDAINQFLEMDFSKLKRHEEEVFQDTLSEFFGREVRRENLSRINEINKLCSSAIVALRANNVNQYENTKRTIDGIMDSLDLNEREKKAASMFEIPVIAYHHYKLGDYQKSLAYTNESIVNDDYFLDRHPFLYGHKIQQLHNLIRVLFKANLNTDACSLCEDTISHLVAGTAVRHNIGEWYPDFDISEHPDMPIMVYQILTATVRTITAVCYSHEQERELYEVAFRSLLNIDKSGIPENLQPLWTFLELKFDLLVDNKFDEDKVNQWVRDVKEASYYTYVTPLFFSLFTSLGVNSYQQNKAEYERIHS